MEPDPAEEPFAANAVPVATAATSAAPAMAIFSFVFFIVVLVPQEGWGRGVPR
ncbi:hypothetical protein [Streptomyces malaysiensis]|uniref:hypothetical protein n=1 Tax=Streptomyces malaysiensis TaxID=92644 RepID=UPI00142EF451|nr:hypothetical protein [Streptomyces malaysiensis]